MNRSVSIAVLALLLSTSAALTGCGHGFPATIAISPVTPTGPTTNPGPAERIYVIQQPTTGASTILQFVASANGVATAASTITPGTKVEQIATDSLGNIYAFNGNIVEYASGASGNPTPIREITTGTASRICCVDGMAVSPAGEIVIGQDNGEVDEWSAKATGAVAPDRYILGYSETGGGLSPVVVANMVAINSADDIYVGTAGGPGVPEIVLFNSTANGNIAPSGTLGPAGLVGGVAVDADNNVYATTDSCTLNGTTFTCTGSISVYAANATANSSPARIISGSLTQLGTLGGITVDSAGNIYVISTDAYGANPMVLTFSKSATGNVAPTTSFSSTAWTTPGFNPSIAIY
jgi:hypothetical protein